MQTLPSTPEFTLQDTGLCLDSGRYLYSWFRLWDSSGGQRFRVVTFKELAYLPIETRDDPDLLGKQWAALRGLYNGDVDFLYTVAGIFAPTHIGVAQFYGAAAEAASEQAAVDEALKRMAAVEAVLANYPFSRLIQPGGERLQLLLERMEQLPHLLAILGHPDPRLAQRGLGRDGALGQEDDELSSQQGEILLRGLAKLREDFVFLVTAAHIGRPLLADALVRMSQIASQYASRQRGAINVGFSIAIPLAAALANAYGGSHSSSESQASGQSDTWSEGWGQGESQSWGHSTGRSQSHAIAHTESSSVTDSESSGRTLSQATGQADSQGTSHTDSGSHTDSHSTGVAHSEGESWSTSSTSGSSQSTSVGSGTTHSSSSGEGSSWSQGQGQSAAVSAGQSSSHSISAGAGQTNSIGVSDSMGQSVSAGRSESSGVDVSAGENWSSGVNESQSQSASLGASASADVNAGIGILGGGVGGGVNASLSESASHGASQSAGGSQSVGLSQSQGSSLTIGGSTGHSESAGQANSTSVGVADSSGHSQSVSQGVSESQAIGGSRSTSQGVAQSQSVSSTSGSFSSTSQSKGGSRSTTNSESWGTADSTGWADATSQAHTDSRSQGQADSVVRARSVSSGVADSESWAEGVSESWSEGRAVSRSYQSGRSHGNNTANGQALALAASHNFAGGFSAGIVPGLSIGRSWQTEDDTAIRLTEIARGLESLLNQASMEGGFLTTALLFVGERGERAAASLVPQAFHGPNVPTPVLTVPGDANLRLHALAFRPSLLPESNPFAVPLLWSRWGTLLTPGMLAAYTAPNLFEEGTAVTIQEKLPPLAFYAERDGDVVLGHLISPETGDLTRVPLRLSRERHFHTAFCGDTGYGKSVAAERMAYETTLRWRLKTIVLDFGAGWRKMLNAPGLDGHVEIRQLSPGGVRPLRWNPLQIGRNILPEVQWRAFCDIFGSIAQLGQKRQIHELRDALRQVYLAHGVLVDDPDCRRDSRWGRVQAEEVALIHVEAGTPIGLLSGEERQRLAAHRSRTTGLGELYGQIADKLATVPPRDSMLRGVLEGILFRLHPLVQGAAATQYAAGDEATDINEIVPGEWGMAVLEGGAFLDDFSKAFLLGWAAWHLYTDAVILRMRRGATHPAHIQIVFEEANKILAGLDRAGGGDESGGGASTAEQFASMWRDSRKYGIWLHLITQSPSEIPQGILSSCNNLFITQLKNPKDRDLVIAGLHRSEKGFVDEGWRRFLASLPVARSVTKLGYSFDRAEVEPCYIQPLLLELTEPSDREIEERLGEKEA